MCSKIHLRLRMPQASFSQKCEFNLKSQFLPKNMKVCFQHLKFYKPFLARLYKTTPWPRTEYEHLIGYFSSNICCYALFFSFSKPQVQKWDSVWERFEIRSFLMWFIGTISPACARQQQPSNYSHFPVPHSGLANAFSCSTLSSFH